MSELPSPQSIRSRLLQTPAFYDFLSAPLAVLTFSIQAYDFWWKAWFVRSVLVVVGGLALIGFNIAKAIATLSQQSKAKQTHELEGCLQALHAVLIHDATAGDTPTLRITVHKPVNKGRELEQIMDYTGALKLDPNRVGRRFPAQSGIIGLAFRKKEPVGADRESDDFEQYVKELIADWSYTEPDARQANPSVFSWMAIPLVETTPNGDEVRGIVYLDCSCRGFFSDGRQTLAKAACSGIARFVNQRYTSAK